MKKGVLLVISGFSGAGKGTIVKKLMQDYDDFALSVSATTRQPREGEVHGREYFFLTKEEFENGIERDQFLEYARYQENYYGTPKAFVEEQMASGKSIILEIDAQGAGLIKSKFPEAVLIFVTAPTVQMLYERLSGRGTETEEKVKGRILLAQGETERIPDYDYLIVNDDLDTAVREVYMITAAETCRTSRNSQYILDIKEEFKDFLKGEK